MLQRQFPATARRHQLELIALQQLQNVRQTRRYWARHDFALLYPTHHQTHSSSLEDWLQPQPEDQESAGSTDEDMHHLPIMPLSKVKLPQETISLQLFEPRYRLLFKLVKQSKSRKFGLVLADQQQGMMESIGCLCELTHYIPVPER